MATQPFGEKSFANECYEFAKTSSLDTRLRNALFHIMQTNPILLVNPDTSRQILKEPLTYFRKAQVPLLYYTSNSIKNNSKE